MKKKWVSHFFFIICFSSCHSFFLKEKVKFRVYNILPTFKTDLRVWYQIFSGTFKNDLKCACCWTITFVQGSGEAQTVWKPTFSGHHTVDFWRKRMQFGATLFNQLLKLNWECGISFSAGAFKNDQKYAGWWTIIKFLHSV